MKITFATAPVILKRIGAADGLDVVIAPPAVLDEWVKAAKATAADRVTVGRIGVGVMVRDGAPQPKIATVDEFKQALLSAESVVYNQASTGIYLEKLFERLGIAEHLKTKTVRYPDAAAVLDHIRKGKGDEIGLGATTVILEGEKQRTQIRRAVAARNPKLHDLRRHRGKRRVRFGSGTRVRPLPHRTRGTESICCSRHPIKGEKTCRCFSERDIASFG